MTASELSTDYLWSEAQLRQLHAWGVKVTLKRQTWGVWWVCGDDRGYAFEGKTAHVAIQRLWHHHLKRRLIGLG